MRPLYDTAYNRGRLYAQFSIAAVPERLTRGAIWSYAHREYTKRWWMPSALHAWIYELQITRRYYAAFVDGWNSYQKERHDGHVRPDDRRLLPKATDDGATKD